MNISTFRLEEALRRQEETEEKQSNEDGTVADLGLAPTGHKKDCDMHSLCVHDIDEDNDFDDGW